MFLFIVLLYHVLFCLIICLCLLNMMRKACFWQQAVTDQGPTRPLHHSGVNPEENGPGVCLEHALTTHCAEKSPGWLARAPRWLLCKCCQIQAGCKEIWDLWRFSAWQKLNPRLRYCLFVGAVKTPLMCSPAWMLQVGYVARQLIRVKGNLLGEMA